MNRLSEKQLLILTIGIAVLLTGGLGYLVWSDLQAAKEEEQKIKSLRDQIASSQSEIDQIPQREYRVIANREKAEKEVAFLPSETEIENFWEVIERFADDSGVLISEITSSDTGRGGRKKGKSTIKSVPQVLSLKGTTDEFLRFMNLLENYDRIINVIEYRLTSSKGPDKSGKLRHGIKMALTTFTYSKKVANTIVSISSYEKKRDHAEVKKWLSKIKIQERETYTLRTSLGRRDPFENVRKPVAKIDPTFTEDRGAQEAIITNLSEEVRSLQDGLDIEAHLRKVKDLYRLAQQIKDNKKQFSSLNSRIEETKRKNLITDRELKDRFRAEVLEPFELIKERMAKGHEGAPKLTRQQVQEWYDRIAEQFDEQNWKDVMELVRDFRQLSKNGKWVEDDARALAVQTIEFQRRATVIQDFEKRKVNISTIVFSPSGVSLAIINGKQLGEGDALDGDGRVLVIEIGENYVIFETEGVEIKRTP